MKCETFARRQNLCECAARKCNNAGKKLRENDEHSQKFCLRAKVSQFDLCERVNFHFAVKIPAKAAWHQTAREKKRKNTIIIIYYILYILYIYSSFSQKKFLFHFSGDFGGFSGDFSWVENVARFPFLLMFFVLFFAFLKSWPFYPRLTKNFQSFVSSLPHLLYLPTHTRLLALFFNPKKCRGRTRKMAVKLYRIINASKTCKGRAAWRLDEVMYPASLPCNPVTPDELQAAIWKQLEEESWFPPIVAFEWHDGNLYLVQHPRNNSTVNQVLTAWRKLRKGE